MTKLAHFFETANILDIFLYFFYNGINGNKRKNGKDYYTNNIFPTEIVFLFPAEFEFFRPAEIAEMAEMGFAQPCGMIIYIH